MKTSFVAIYCECLGKFRAVMGAFALVTICVTLAHAEDRFWDANGTAPVGGGSGTWDTAAALWANDLAGSVYVPWNNAAGDDARFGQTAGTVTIAVPVSANSIIFSTNGYTLTGASITLVGLKVVDTGSFNATISAPVVGTVGLAKTGSGTLTLTGTNTYTGETTVSVGTLRLNGSTDAGSQVNVLGGAKLSGGGTVGGDLVLSPGGRIEPGSLPGTIGNLTVNGSMIWGGSGDGSATILVDADANGISDRIVVNGDITRGAGTTFRIDFQGTGHVGTYTLLQSVAGTHNLEPSHLSYSNLPDGLSGTFDTSNPKLVRFTVRDDVAPTIAISEPSETATDSGPVTYTITYTDDNLASISLSEEDITLNATGTAKGTIEVTGSGNVRTVTISDISGNGTLGISIAQGTAVDSGGQEAPSAGPSETFVVVNSEPVLSGATTAGASYGTPFTYTVSANVPVTFSAGNVPPGLTLAAADDNLSATISGTPTSPATYIVNIKGTDPLGNSGALSVTITVAPKVLTVSGLTVVSRPYNGSALATLNTSNASLTGVLPGDVGKVTLVTSTAVAVFNNANAGTNKPVTVTGLVLSGSAASKYSLAAPTDLTGTIQALSQTVTFPALEDRLNTDGPITLEATASSGLPVSYTVTGPATLNGNVLTLTGAEGTVTVTALQTGNGAYGSATPVVRTFVVYAVSRLLNVSALSHTGGGANVLITGFSVSGDATKRVLIRVAGPALQGFGVAGTLDNPSLELYSGTNLLASNDDWGSPVNPDLAALMTAAGAFPFEAGSRDAALVVKLSPGGYSVLAQGGEGMALTEVYEVLESGEAPSLRRLNNLSVRGAMESGGAVTAGFVIEGRTPKKVLVRGVGPTIASTGLSVIADPKLQIFDGTQTLVKENDDWFRDSAAAEISAAAQAAGAFPLGAQSLDAAAVVELAPGSYTSRVTNVSGAAGIVLVEVYELP